MRIRLAVDDHTVELSTDMLLAVACELDSDVPEQREALLRLAAHDDYEIRSVVAIKEGLSDSCYCRLATDPCVDVVTGLLSNDSFHHCAGLDQYLPIASRDPRLAYELAQVLDDLDDALQEPVGQWLIGTGDRKVKQCLAVSDSTPVSLLHTLSEDANVAIAVAALRSLGDATAASDDDDSLWEEDDDEAIDNDDQDGMNDDEDGGTDEPR